MILIFYEGDRLQVCALNSSGSKYAQVASLLEQDTKFELRNYENHRKGSAPFGKNNRNTTEIHFR
jgi:hypothetical protein